MIHKISTALEGSVKIFYWWTKTGFKTILWCEQIKVLPYIPFFGDCNKATLTHTSLRSFLWDIGADHDQTPQNVITDQSSLFAYRTFI